MLTGNEKIVVIEDDLSLIKIMKDLFPLLKINSQFAVNGTDGINLINEIVPDLIICDIMLPDMQGYDVLTAIKGNAKTYKIPFVFLSAFAEPIDIRKGMNLGADDYLTKPFTSSTLLKTIEARLEIKKKNEQIDITIENDKWLSVFSGNFNHEFMTPLNGIINSIDLMKRNQLKIDPIVIEELTSAIYASGYRMMRNTRKLVIYTYLSSSKKQSTTLKKVSNLNEILVDSVNQLKKQYFDKKININLNICDSTCDILGNYEYIKFLFDELLDNAYKFNIDNLPIELILKGKAANKFFFEIVNYSSLEENELNITSVKPFKRFHSQLDMNGLGLGLSNCKSICEYLSYAFEIENTDGYVKIRIEF